jgi:hypothetical protein
MDGVEPDFVSRIDAYGKPTEALHCPDCDAPLLGAYEESPSRGLELILSCAADCGYSRRPPRVEARGPEDGPGTFA